MLVPSIQEKSWPLPASPPSRLRPGCGNTSRLLLCWMRTLMFEQGSSCGSRALACLSAGNRHVISAKRHPAISIIFTDCWIAVGKRELYRCVSLALAVRLQEDKETQFSQDDSSLLFFLKPKVRTGISKPYNVKQIKTTTAEEAEEAIRCLMEAKGGEHSFLSSTNPKIKKTVGVFLLPVTAQMHVFLCSSLPERWHAHSCKTVLRALCQFW